MPSAVFILIHDGRVLMEQRPDRDDDFFPRAWLFPGGKLNPGEEPVAALLREATEELGIAIVDAEPLCAEQEVYYARPNEQSHRLYPWLVTRWYGEVPDHVLDSEAVLAWRTLNDALSSPVDCTRQMAEGVLRAIGKTTTCHAPKHAGPAAPAAYELTYRLAPTRGSRPVWGMVVTEGVCGACRIVWAQAIEQDGGDVIGLKALPEPAAPIAPEPVGLDAIAPAVAERG
jgi:8-oxo-dGTP pyrophosphatase MutT (NUDIX family)